MKYLYLFIFGLAALAIRAQNAEVSINFSNIPCAPGQCITLDAQYPALHETTAYTVSPIPFQPLYPFTGGTMMDSNYDDTWTTAVTLPFNFCFYGQAYDQVYVGSNGVVTFDVSGYPLSPDSSGLFYCPWNFAGSIPSVSFPIKNAIYGVYQDTDIRTTSGIANPAVQNVNYYTGGVSPNRYCVINFNQLPTFQCNTSVGLQTSQIVLHETTNVVDVFVSNRTPCTSWQSGVAVIGVQNAAGTNAVTPPGRNTGSWNATNEAWRFSPSGNEIVPTIEWSGNGAPLAVSGSTVTVCPETETLYSAIVTYAGCAGNIAGSATQDIWIAPGLNLADPQDMTACSETGTATFNIDQTATILGGQSSSDFDVAYFLTQQDAYDYTNNNLTDLVNFNAVDGQQIFVRVENLATGTGCFEVKSFTLHVTVPTGAPSGAGTQYFTQGDTLADLIVEGNNITWYDAATGGNQLPESTQLVHDTTYYAEQENEDVCPAGRSNSVPRLAVTVYDVALGIDQHALSQLSITPNPAADHLEIASPIDLSTVSVFNLLGQELNRQTVSGKHISISVSALAAGTYLLKVHTFAGDKVLKFVKR